MFDVRFIGSDLIYLSVVEFSAQPEIIISNLSLFLPSTLMSTVTSIKCVV